MNFVIYIIFFSYFKQCVCKQCKDTASFGDSGKGSVEGSVKRVNWEAEDVRETGSDVKGSKV